MGGKKRITIGYRYSMGMHMVVCHSPIDELQEIVVGDRSAWPGPGNTASPVTTNTVLNIDEPGLFGGEKKEGGIVGQVEINLGAANQGQSPYLQAQLGDNIPAFRGVFSVVLRRCYLTAMTNRIKPWAFRVKAIPGQSWYPERAEIAGTGTSGQPGFIPGGSANPAHIIRECFINPDWGLGLPTTSVDDASFRAAADTLFNENLGLSLILARQGRVQDFITLVARHINCVIYTDLTTGNFILRLIREPTQSEIDNALVLSESNSELTKFERPSFADMINEIVIKYRPQGLARDASTTVQDLASIEAQGGTVSQTADYPGIDNDTIANNIGQRELRQFSTPLASVTIRSNRLAWNVRPGDIVRIQSNRHGIANMVIRVFDVNYGELQDGNIIISGTEDIYTLPSTSYLAPQPTGWVEPIGPPQPIVDQIAVEMPYYVVNENLTPSELAEVSSMSAFLEYAGANPGIVSTNYQLFIDPTGAESNFAFEQDTPYTPTVVLSNNITDIQQSVAYDATGGDLTDIQVGQYAYLGTEVIRVDAIDTTTRTLTLGRAALDSIPTSHSAGGRIYFAQTDSAVITGTEYMASETISIKSVTLTSIGLLSLNDATNINATFVGRLDKPYPPSNVRANNQVTLNRVNVRTTLAFTWNHQNRLQQTAQVTDWFTASSASPEVGTVYPFEIRGEGNVLLAQENVSTTSYNFTSATELSISTLRTATTNEEFAVAALGLDTGNAVYQSFKTVESTYSAIPVTSPFRRLGSDYVTVYVNVQLPVAEGVRSIFIEGSTGDITVAANNYQSYFAANFTINNPFNLRPDAVPLPDDTRFDETTGWVYAGSTSSVPIRSYNCNFLGTIDDYYVFATISLGRLSFVASESTNRSVKIIDYFRPELFVVPRSQFTTTSSLTFTRAATVDSFFVGEQTIFDNANEANLPIADLDDAFASLFADRTRDIPVRFYSVGRLIYFMYRGPSQTTSSSGKNVNMLNLLQSHITVAYTNKMITKRYTISTVDGALTLVDTRDGLWMVGRANVADTQSIEWAYNATSYAIVNSVTGATISTVNYDQALAIRAMAVDYVVGDIYAILRDSDVIVKITLATGVESERANIDVKGLSVPPFHDLDLFVSNSGLYFNLNGGLNYERFDKTLTTQTTTGIRITVPLGVTEQQKQLDVHADSGLLYNYVPGNLDNVLYNEAGGAAPVATGGVVRQHDEIKYSIKSMRGSAESLHTYEKTIPRTGYGYRYGEYYGE